MIQEQIEKDLRQSTLDRNTVKTETLRFIKAAFLNARAEKNAGEFTDEVALKVLLKLAKQRQESIEIYEKNNRLDLADKEAEELSIIKEYLPKTILEEDLKKIIDEVIDRLKPTVRDMGKVMNEVKSSVTESGFIVDGKSLSEKVKSLLK